MSQYRLRQLRENAALSVAQLARRSGLNINVIYRIESGKAKRPRPLTIRSLAKALSVRQEEILAPPLTPIPPTPTKPYRPAAKWLVIIRCPKCRQRFRLEVTEGEADPIEGMVICPICAFSQTISLRRAS